MLQNVTNCTSQLLIRVHLTHPKHASSEHLSVNPCTVISDALDHQEPTSKKLLIDQIRAFKKCLKLGQVGLDDPFL